MAKTWVKLYVEINRDPKMGSLTWEQKGLWSALLALAGEIDDRDDNDVETGLVDTIENVAWRIRCDGEMLEQALAVFFERGMIAYQDGVLLLAHYGERQARKPSDRRRSIRQRVQRYRNAHVSQDENGCNADVTRYGGDVTPGNALRRDADTDTDADADADAAAAPVGPLAQEDANAARFFTALERFGLNVNSASVEQYEMVLAEAGDYRIIELALEEAARTNVRPNPKWLSSVVSRCQREGVLPGQWGAGGARASPPDPIPKERGPIAYIDPTTGERKVWRPNDDDNGSEPDTS